MKRILAVILLLLAFAGCGAEGVSDILNFPPSGFMFTDEDGNQVTSISRGHWAQLRDLSGNVLLQFKTEATINFQNVTAGRDATKTFVHFASGQDKYGLTGDLLLFIPCTSTTDQITVCPSAAALADITTGCTDAVTLTIASPTSGHYTWSNATTRSGTADCEVSAAVMEFGTGAFGESTGSGGLTADDFPNVGVCADKNIETSSDAFKSALAAATSFTFMHKSYTSDADIPFICGKEGTWDPGVDGAFATTNDLDLTDSTSDILGGMFGHVFICNTGFNFTTLGWGFHDAGTYRGEIQFVANSKTYRVRTRFTVSGNDAGKTLASLGLAQTDISMKDGSGNLLATASNVRNLFAANPTNITVNATSASGTHLTATGGFICATEQ